ncbi:DEHA2B14498p [Debaryomyces hansenii CBS767]|uniref:DEHA2B14498p n=1 Tax=Debaryomyces hansenii (strain ATCC 36239 / CBS 767 / BCRC 21394 / JCM 1990 / NBRC 0083 / IGC 2968) TaxID=284592 RepID=Q6BW43_DEBHA|nr:DEHA2B14498p [Debaryomyces hansenii CBS767]CAG85587.2 DEHA2B14498p [Debaryomyces hansenii CBS767]|eukprot:XP_457576.2 DEHA2B14498p [Debaryomyces hansenii CBS767]
MSPNEHRRNQHPNSSPNHAFETNSRFFPVISSQVAYRNNELNSNVPTSPRNPTNRPSTPSNSPARPQLALNDGMFYVRPESDSQSLNLEEQDVELSNTDPNRAPNSSPVSPHQEVIASALGFSSNSRVYQLSATNSSNGAHNSTMSLMGSLVDSPSSKEIRKYLASRPVTAPTGHRKRIIKLTKPDHNLEAPGLKDDFYCNVVSWSKMTNRIAVGLNKSVYSWSTNNDVVLMHHDNYITVTAVSYSDHDYILIGKDNGEVLMLSQRENAIKATLSNHDRSIFCFQWFPGSRQFLAGDSKGDVLCVNVTEDSMGNVSLRIQCILECHQQQICGLALSNDSQLLAVGGNDNCCSIWDVSDVLAPKIKSVLPHKAAVKAIAFCPWANSILATGGGSNDRTIRFWHANTGTLLNTFAAKAQVTSLFWCKDRKELISTFGYGNSEKPLLLSVFSYPEMTPLIEVSSTTYLRCLSACQSPDRSSICVAANDSFVRIYKIWQSTEGPPLSPGSRSIGIYGSSLIEMYEGITRGDILR